MTFLKGLGIDDDELVDDRSVEEKVDEILELSKKVEEGRWQIKHRVKYVIDNTGTNVGVYLFQLLFFGGLVMMAYQVLPVLFIFLFVFVEVIALYVLMRKLGTVETQIVKLSVYSQ